MRDFLRVISILYRTIFLRITYAYSQARLQLAQASAQPKIAKELTVCQRFIHQREGICYDNSVEFKGEAENQPE